MPSEAGVNVSTKEGVIEDDLALKTSLDILEKFADDWLKTLDKDESNSISLFLCYHYFPSLKLRQQNMLLLW